MSDSELKNAVQAQFAASAEAYVTSSVHANKHELQRMVDLADLHGNERVLDVATGGGHVARAFAPHVAEVIASDLTPRMLEAAKRFIESTGVKNVRFEIADAEALPFPAAAFDVVTCRVAAHHFPNVQRFVHEVTRVLRPGGSFVLEDTIAPEDPELDQFINTIEKMRDPTHGRDYTVPEWHDFCTSAGLRVVSSETFRKTIPFTEWCQRMRVDDDTTAELNRRLLTASPDTQTTFAVVRAEGHVEQFDLHCLLLLARKP